MSASSGQTIIVGETESQSDDGIESCYVLHLKDEFSENNQKTTTDSGYSCDNPLELYEGRYKISLDLSTDHQPYKCPQLHVKASPKAPTNFDWIPLYHVERPHNLALIFKSEDSSEKEQTRPRTAIDDETMQLGTHTLRLGDIKVMIIGSIHMDFVDEKNFYEDDAYVTRTIDVNLEFWLRVVQPRI